MKRILLTIVILATLATAAQAQVIGATSNDAGSRQNTSTYKQKGSYLKFEAGYPFSIAYDYQISPYIALGGGVGFHLIEVFSHGPMAFGEFTASTPFHRWGLFTNLRFGLGLGGNEFLYGYYGVSVGGSYKNFKLGIGIQDGMRVVRWISSNGDSGSETYFGHGLMLYVSYSLPLWKL